MKVVKQKENQTTVWLEEGEHLWVETPVGMVKVMVSDAYSTITSWVKNTHYSGFYNQKVKKETTAVSKTDVKHITITPKRDA